MNPAVSSIDRLALQHGNEAAPACFHCGLPVGSDLRWQVEIEQQAQPMCCPGCAAVAQAIVDSGFADYYRTRTAYSETADASQSLVPAELKLFDAEQEQQRYATLTAENLREAVFSVEGIRCAACVWLIERRLARLPGVAQASMNVSTERLHLRWDPAACKPSDVLQSMRQVGYTAYPFDPVRQGAQLQKSGRKLFRQLFIAGLSMMQVMMYAVPVYMATDGTMDADMETLMRWASLLLTVPAVVYSAQPFFAGAWASLRSRSLGMDVPVALGIGAAFIGSVVATLRGHGDVYFDSVTMFIFLLLCSRYLEVIARRRAASALERLQHAMPASATLLAGYPATMDDAVVGAAQLQAGDVIRVRPGEAFAVDGILIEGDTAVDLSLLTGESRPQHKRVGEAVPGGAVNASQPVLLRVSRAVAESTLSTLVKLIERAGQGKPQLALWADKVAGWFVAVLLLFAVSIFVAWWFIDPARAWPIAIAVLVVSCPCALSLATPSALAAATDALVRQGVLVIQPHVLETLHRATHIVFDKTGTLTQGRPVLQSCTLLGELEEEQVLQLAAALEASSLHPLARAFTEAADGLPPLPVGDPGSVAGEGLSGTINGKHYRIGRHAFVAAVAGGQARDATEEPGEGTVYLGMDGAWLARFALSDALRPESADVVAKFRRAGKHVLLLSGDRQQTVDHVAAQLGITERFGDKLPGQKLALVQALQAQGAVVAMVGDGINDAAVLKAADVSFAMGSGAALAQTHADTVLMSGRVDAVWCAAQTAGRTMSVVRQNLWWASIYNLVAIPAAALGWLNPWMAGVGMSLSSALVVANALRLARTPRRPRGQ